jgi:hypothetical protein
MPDDPDKHAMMERIKNLVQRILAKCRQGGTTLRGLQGINLSRPANSSRFVDLHAAANAELKQSWHLKIQEDN